MFEEIYQANFRLHQTESFADAWSRSRSEWHHCVRFYAVFVFSGKTFRIEFVWMRKVLQGKLVIGIHFRADRTINKSTFESLWIAYMGMIICIPCGITKSSNGSREYPLVAVQTLSRNGNDGYILRLSVNVIKNPASEIILLNNHSVTLHDHI